MKRKIEISVLVLLVGLSIVAIILTTGKDNQQPLDFEPTITSSPTLSSREITIRNMTKEAITFYLKTYNSAENPHPVAISPQEIYRFSASSLTQISFKQGNESVSRLLSPGNPYAFRYDENNLVEIWQASHSREDAIDLAPYVPTPLAVVDKMLELAELSSDDVIYDLGCGDGRIVISAASKYGVRGVGIDIVPERIKESKENAKKAGVENKVEFILDDVLKVDISEATVVTLYLLPESNALLRPKLEKELRPGTYVISHNYTIPGWENKLIKEETVVTNAPNEHNIYVYRR